MNFKRTNFVHSIFHCLDLGTPEFPVIPAPCRGTGYTPAGIQDLP